MTLLTSGHLPLLTPDVLPPKAGLPVTGDGPNGGHMTPGQLSLLTRMYYHPVAGLLVTGEKGILAVRGRDFRDQGAGLTFD